MATANNVMPNGISGESAQALTEKVTAIIAEVTRYPAEILLPDANLEEDLGIDSVKRAEILAVLQARLSLPEPEPDENMVPPRTVGDVITAVAGYMQQANGATAPPAPSPTPEPQRNHVKENGTHRSENGIAPSAPANGSLMQSVVTIIAEVTGYPTNLLKPEANLEEDLGFHVGQQGAIFAALRSRLNLTVPEGAALPAVKTIQDVVTTVQRLQSEPAPLNNNHQPSVRPEPTAVSSKPLTGKVALVTGSGHGLGKAIAAHLSNLGATVVVNSFHSRQRGEETTAEIVAAGGNAVHIWGSVTNPSHMDGMFQEIETRFGGLDFLVHNASNGILASMQDIQPDHWDKAFRTNVIGLHQSALLAAPMMRRRGGGKIVALSSVGAQRCLDYLGCIGTVKAAVESLVRYLAVEMGGDNIQVNAVSAGPVYGELMEKYPDLEKLRPMCEDLTPRNRLNDEQEVADAVTFLLTNSGMSGSVLLLDAAGSQRIVASSS